VANDRGSSHVRSNHDRSVHPLRRNDAKYRRGTGGEQQRGREIPHRSEKAERVADPSPYTQDKIGEYKGYVLSQQHKDAEAGALFEQLAKSASASRRSAENQPPSI
jgi:hypothetical protein